MASLIKILAEENRQRQANDDKFYKNFLYYFELSIPTGAIEGLIEGTTKTFLFPLILNPQGITMQEPFSVRATPTSKGGLFVEENGIIQRTMTIRGHTGFKPRPNFTSPISDRISTERDSFERRGTWSPFALSGQRHFHFLQDRVFRVYGDLKKDPAFSRDTTMKFHNPKDDEHWLVVPKNFMMERDSARPTLYNYTIELLIVDRAKAAEEANFSEDKPLLDKIKDFIRTVQNAIDSVIAVINDVTAFINEIENIVASIGATLNRVSAFLTAATNLVNGTADVIARPFKEVANIVSSLESAINLLIASSISAKDTVVNSFRQMIDAFDQFAIHPQLYETPTQQRLRLERRRQELSTSTTQAALDAAAADPATNTRELENRGTALQPGDADRARAERAAGRNEPVYASAVERIVEQGDTLPNLAARYLGDARLWRKIAALNGLKPPFITQQATPETKGIGDSILIPSQSPPPEALVLTTIFGVLPTAGTAERAFGTDFQLTENPNLNARGFVDMVVNAESGSTDFKRVVGIPCLAQGIVTRVTTEQGSNMLYRLVGYKRLVGSNIPGVDADAAEFRLAEAVQADPRIITVKGVRLNELASPDAIDVEIDAAVRGFSEQVTIRALVS